MLLVPLRMQSPLLEHFGKAVKTLGNAQALVSSGTRGIFGRFAKVRDQVV